MGVSIDYTLTGSGWSQCELAIDADSLTVTASYLSDALRSLVSATCRVLEGQPDSTAAFAEEPGEYRWRLYLVDDATVRVLILEFDDLWSHKPDSDGKPIFDRTCNLRTFAGALYDSCKTVLATHGVAGYKDRWVKHEFPADDIERLRALLRNRQAGG